MKTRLRLIACLGTLVALVAGREDANAVQRAASSNVSTAVLYTDGWIIRLAQDEQSDSPTQLALEAMARVKTILDGSGPPTESPPRGLVRSVSVVAEALDVGIARAANSSIAACRGSIAPYRAN